MSNKWNQTKIQLKKSIDNHKGKNSTKSNHSKDILISDHEKCKKNQKCPTIGIKEKFKYVAVKTVHYLQSNKNLITRKSIDNRLGKIVHQVPCFTFYIVVTLFCK